jgi:hypothetical protein
MDRIGDGIAIMVEESAGSRHAGVSLLFAGGSRPDADAIALLASQSAQADGSDVVGFSISHRPTERPYWLELLALGLTFDLQGLAPGVPANSAKPAYAFSLPLAEAQGLEGLTLRPGPHLAAGSTLLPVIRAMAALARELARLPGVIAVGWEPARTAMTPDYYRRVVSAWLMGGAFPGLGLCALNRLGDGAVESDGLAFFTGHEIRLEPLAGESPADAARFAIRVIHDLVENGPYPSGRIDGPGGVGLNCEFNANGAELRITRGGKPTG